LKKARKVARVALHRLKIRVKKMKAKKTAKKIILKIHRRILKLRTTIRIRTTVITRTIRTTIRYHVLIHRARVHFFHSVKKLVIRPKIRAMKIKIHISSSPKARAKLHKKIIRAAKHVKKITRKIHRVRKVIRRKTIVVRHKLIIHRRIVIHRTITRLTIRLKHVKSPAHKAKIVKKTCQG
jgi:hypothetical protein